MSVTIDGIVYAVPVVGIRRKAEFLDKYGERVETGEFKRELVGVYLHYELQFGRTTDTTVYAALWDKLTEAVDSHTVTVPDESGDYTFTAHLENVGDELSKTGAKNYWKSLTAHFIAILPANVPT